MNMDVTEKWIYNCHHCGKELSRKQTLKTHLSCIHGEVVSPAKRKYKVYESNPFAEVPKTTKYRWKKLKDLHNASVRPVLSNESTAPSETEDLCNTGCEITVQSTSIPLSSTEEDDSPSGCASSNVSVNDNDRIHCVDDINWENTMDICGEDISGESSENESTDSEPNENDISSDSDNDIIQSPPLYVLSPSNEVYKSDISHYEHMLAVNALAASGNLSGLVFENVLDLIKLHVPEKNLCERTVNDIKKKLGFDKGYLKNFEYCNVCGAVSDDSTRICKTAGCTGLRSNKDYFVVGDVGKQIKEILERKGNWQKIQDELKRPKSKPFPIVDITSGGEYRKMAVDEGFLDKKNNNITLIFNTDGVSLFKSTNVSLWPVYLAINELPPRERFLLKNMVIWGIWQGTSKPVMDTFMSQFVRDMILLERQGVNLIVDGERIQCCAKVVIGTMDLPARASVLNTVHHNGLFSCIYCENSGKVVKSGNGHARSFPFLENTAKARNVESISRDIEEAVLLTKTVKGFNGRCAIGCLPGFSPVDNIGIDYMHACLAGITKRLIRLFIDGTSFKEEYFIGHKVPLIDKQLKSLCVPYHINRKPRRLSHYQKWKSSEFRSWLLFYSIPCLASHLSNVYLKHYSCLVEGIYILLQSSLTEEDLNQSGILLNSFYKHASALYGENFVGLNVHNLSHLPECVRKWGPLWAYSCFGFESANGEILKNIHGKKNVCSQVFWALQAQKRLETESEFLPEGRLKNFMKKTIGKNAADSDRLIEAFQCKIFPKITACGPADLTTHIQQVINQHIGCSSENAELHRAEKIKRNGLIFFSKQCKKVKSTNSYTIVLEQPLDDGTEVVQVQYYLVHKEKLKVFAVCSVFMTEHLKIPRQIRHLKVATKKRDLVVVPATMLKEHAVFMVVEGQTYICNFPNFVERD